MTSGREKDTAIGDVVVITVRSDGPCGIILEPGRDGSGAAIRAWERLPNGKFGPIQKHGGVHIGDIIISINGNGCDQMSYNEIVSMLQDRNVLTKDIKFMNSSEYYRSRNTSSMRQDNANGKDVAKASFLSIVRRSRINQSSATKFVEFEVASQFKLPSTKVEKEKIYKWSVWKRYSEFEKLHEQLCESLGWQMEGIEFPSPHTFVMNKFSSEFIESRREELNKYWQKLIAIDKITEFHKHHCSEALKLFIDVTGVLRGDREVEVAPSAAVPSADGSASDAAAKSTAPKASTRRQSMRKAASAKRSALTSPNEQSVSPSAETTASPVESPKSVPTEPKAKTTCDPAPNPATTQKAAPVAQTPAAAPTTTQKSANLPPKPTGARVNLLNQINSMRKE